jgi:CRP-like cAMP-binding protein
MYLVADGVVQIVHGGQQLASIERNGYFGEMSILDGEPRSATALAATDCLLLKIRQEDFHQILSMHFDTALAVIQTLSRNLRAHVAQFTTPVAEDQHA